LSTRETYPLSLHDALPISPLGGPGAIERLPLLRRRARSGRCRAIAALQGSGPLTSTPFRPILQPTKDIPVRLERFTSTKNCPAGDRKSTRLNSSHQIISYA